MVDRDTFYAKARAQPFGGTMNQKQVDGINTILDQWDKEGKTDPRWLAYMLATTFWETARTMQPIKEYGEGRGLSYGIPDPGTGQIYFGRGFVQLTWKYNYEKFAKLLGVDLVNQPDLALDPGNATEVLFKGMEGGLFTGAGLGRYFNDTIDDPVNARRIINGTDHAQEIANIHREFLSALTPEATA